VRLGVYADLVYRRAGGTISTDLNFIQVATGLADRVDELVVFGRLHPEKGRALYALPSGVRFVPLPYYPSAWAAGTLLRAGPAAVRVFAAELGRLDAVWLFGPHPWALAFAGLARLRKVAVVIGVRQEYRRYIAGRLPTRRWVAAVPLAYLLERMFQLLARRVPAVVVGEELGQAYRGGRAPVLATGFSLVKADDVVSPSEALARAWDGDLRLLAVGRVDAEKNPLLLPEVVAALRRRGAPWKLTVAGDGPLSDALASRIAELALEDAVDLRGHVPHGPELTALYRSAHAFLHVSFTEGVPQVLFEAQGAGLPIVATDVGGVRAALGDGASALMIPPDDAEAAADAVDRLRLEPALRERLIVTGVASVQRETSEAQLERLERFLREAVSASR
jgi:glycosyltransferase involved in cell wall biosynthesis